jgi:hypothetical protein
VTGRLHTHARLLDRWRTDDLAITALDAVGVGSRGGTIWMYRIALVGTLQLGRLAHDRATRRNKHPVLQEMARRIHWWQYSGCRMASFTPWYIILGQFGIALALTLLARTLRRGSWRMAILAGIAGGLLIFICYAVAFFIADRLIP